MCSLVEFPIDCTRLHLRSQGGDKPGDQIQGKIAVAENGVCAFSSAVTWRRRQRLRMRTGFHRPENKASSDRKLQAECLNYESDWQPGMTRLLEQKVLLPVPDADSSALPIRNVSSAPLDIAPLRRALQLRVLFSARVLLRERLYRARLTMSPWLTMRPGFPPESR